MCRRVTCSSCGKATWAGCGAHVEQVMGGVAESDRCQCERPQPPSFGSVLNKLFKLNK